MEFLADVEEFIGVLAQVLGISDVWAALVVGGVVFSLAAGIVGRIVFKFGVWRRQAAAADQPQTATTSKTPRQVVEESAAARTKLLGCWLLVLTLMLGAVLCWLDLFDDVALMVLQLLGLTR